MTTHADNLKAAMIANPNFASMNADERIAAGKATREAIATVTFDAELDAVCKLDAQYALEFRSVKLAQQGYGSHPVGNTVASDRAHGEFLAALANLSEDKLSAFGTYRAAYVRGDV